MLTKPYFHDKGMKLEKLVKTTKCGLLINRSSELDIFFTYSIKRFSCSEVNGAKILPLYILKI